MRTGTSFDDYPNFDFVCKLPDELKGANGDIYLFYNTENLTFYILKVGDSDQVSIIHHEAEAMTKIQEFRPLFRCYISSVEETDFSRNRPYLLMDFIPGVNLMDLILFLRRDQDIAPYQFSPLYRVIIIYGIAKELSIFHNNDIIHCDIKPENVFIDCNFIPHLGDCGDCIFGDDDTLQSAQHGTANYLPPEAIVDATGKIGYSKAYDIYQLGGTIFHIITLHWPYSNIDSTEFIFEKIKNRELDDRLEPSGDLSVFLDDVNSALYEHVIKPCWEFNPGDRIDIDSIVQVVEQIGQNLLDDTDKSIFNDFMAFLNSQSADEPPGLKTNIEKAINEGYQLFQETSLLIKAAQYLTVDTEPTEESVDYWNPIIVQTQSE